MIDTDYGSEYFDADQASDIRRGQIEFLDFMLFGLMWALVVASSIVGLGPKAGLPFLLVAAFLMMRNIANAVPIWILFMFVPDVSVSFQIPAMFRVILALSVLIYLISGRMGTLDRFVNRLTLYVFFFIVFLTLLLPITPNLSSGFNHYINYIQGFVALVVFMALISDHYDVARIMKWWAIIAAMSIIPAFIHMQMGYSSYYARVQTAIQGEEYIEERGQLDMRTGDTAGRLLWAGTPPNGASIRLVFPLGLAVGLLMTEKRKLFWFIITSLIFVALLGTFSRSGFLTACFMVMVFIAKKNIKAIIPAIALAGCGLVVISFVPAFSLRIQSIIDNIQVEGGSGRFAIWTETFRIWLGSPLWGAGINAVAHRLNYATHNTYLQLLAETGIFGFSMYMAILVLVVKSLSNVKKYAVYYMDSPRIANLTLGLELAFWGVSFHLLTINMIFPMYYWWQYGLCFMFAKTIFQDFPAAPPHETMLEEYSESVICYQT